MAFQPMPLSRRIGLDLAILDFLGARDDPSQPLE
jgi:hypothetical protein